MALTVAALVPLSLIVGYFGAFLAALASTWQVPGNAVPIAFMLPSSLHGIPEFSALSLPVAALIACRKRQELLPVVLPCAIVLAVAILAGAALIEVSHLQRHLVAVSWYHAMRPPIVIAARR